MFYSVEGLDGSGGTTLVETISDEYPQAVTTSEPSDRSFGKRVRERLAQDTDPLIDFYLFMCDRTDHINNRVRPADEAGRLVVSDRYADSTRAYQPVALTESGVFDSQWQAKHFIETTMRPWNYEPDLTLYIDISVDTAIERSSGEDKYEDREFLKQVRDNYQALCESKKFGHRIVRIDGEQPREEVATSALAKLDVAPPDRL